MDKALLIIVGAGSGIQVAYVSVNGRVSKEDPERTLDAIAEQLWHVYDSSATDVLFNI